MLNNFLWIILSIHFLSACIYFAFILTRRSHLRREHIILIFLVPVFGPLIAVTIDSMYRWGHPGQKIMGLETLRLEDDIYWKKIKQSKESHHIVPLEEAILIDDIKVRRKAVFEVIEEDPLKYMNVLMMARDNDDVDTVHHAITQISKAMKFFQLQIQKHLTAIENNLEAPELMNDFIQLFGKYIESGLLEESMLTQQRLIYSKLLDKRLELTANDKNILIWKLRNCINLKIYPAAFEVSDVLKKRWPYDEQTWIEALRVCVEGQDQERFHKTIEEIRHTPVNWTEQGREQVSLWVDV
jgi:hypothetical protein